MWSSSVYIMEISSFVVLLLCEVVRPRMSSIRPTHNRPSNTECHLHWETQNMYSSSVFETHWQRVSMSHRMDSRYDIDSITIVFFLSFFPNVSFSSFFMQAFIRGWPSCLLLTNTYFNYGWLWPQTIWVVNTCIKGEEITSYLMSIDFFSDSIW